MKQRYGFDPIIHVGKAEQKLVHSSCFVLMRQLVRKSISLPYVTTTLHSVATILFSTSV